MWYKNSDIPKYPQIKLENLHGYVLPHAGTAHSGSIIGKTLRFRPTKKFKKVIIMYLPSEDKYMNDIDYHEYYVPYMSFKYIFSEFKNIKFIPFNVLRTNYKFLKYNFNLDDTIVILSADFSHFLPLQEAYKLENLAAHAIENRYIPETNNLPKYIRIIDDIRTFRLLFRLLPPNYYFQWVGRTRSEGEKGVGYLSFIIRKETIFNNLSILPDGIFITCYDKNMIARECLGNWFNTKNQYNSKKENNLLYDVIDKSKKISRLTGGKDKQIPLHSCIITYLFLDNKLNFIRGWHGIRYGAFYLSDVMLENTFDDGKWIKELNKVWQRNNKFNMEETLQQLCIKAGKSNINSNVMLYSSCKKVIIL